MRNLRDQIELHFVSIGQWVYQYRFFTLIVVIGLTAALFSQLYKLSVDTSNDAFYHPDDPIRVAYNEFRQKFGKDDHIYVGLKPDELFDTAFLKQLQQLQNEIEERVPHVNKVTSLINARNIYGQDDELIIEDLIDPIPESSEELAVLKSKALDNAFYRNYLLSEDGRFTVIDIEPVAVTTKHSLGKIQPSVGSYAIDDQLKYISTQEYAEMMDALQPILDKYNDAGLINYVGGFPVVTDRLTRAIEQTMAELTPLSILLNILFLSLMFRCLSGVVYPILIVILTLISTIGAMAWLSISLDLVTTILPTLLTVVGVADSVHLLSGFYQEYQKNGGDKKAAIAHAMGRNGLAILMTSVTTSVGLLSFAMADVAPIAHLGLVAPIGIILAFIYTVLLLPALIAIFPMRAPKSADVIPGVADRLLDWVASISCRRSKTILLIGAVLFVVALSGASQLRLSHNALTWFPEDSKVRSDVVLIDSALGGSVPIEVVIDTGKQHGLYEPELIQRLDASSAAVMTMGTNLVTIGNTYSIHTVLKEINRALHGNNEAFYLLPDSRALTAQEFLLFEISDADDLHKIVTDDYSMVRFTAMVPFTDAIQIKPVLEKIRVHFRTSYPDAAITLTGIGPMLVETIYDVLTTMIKSYSFALVVITGLMILFIGGLRIGLISMLPNLLPIVLAMGIMGWMGMPFDFSSMLVGSVAIGLVVDDTIHFFHNLRRNFSLSGDIQVAIRDTLRSAGRAIFITSMVLASGLAIALIADLRSTANFGIITASTILLALMADFFLAPALLYAIYGRTNQADKVPELLLH